MKNSSSRILQAVKWASPLAAVALAVALSQTALAQPDPQMNTLQGPTAVFVDVTNAPVSSSSSHIDMFFTNKTGEVLTLVNLTGWSGEFNMPGDATHAGPGGESFVATNYNNMDAYGNQVVAITNLSIQLTSGGTSGSYAAGGVYNGAGAAPNLTLTTSFPLTAVQPYQISFWQISGTSDPSGLGSNATLISQIITQPGHLSALGDWITFSNFVVYLVPGTTNAYTATMTTNGFGYAAWGINTNGGETTASPGPYANGRPVMITNGIYFGQSSTVGTVNYGISAGLQNGLYISNYDALFFMGVATNFIAPLITTNPVSSVVFTGTTGQSATFFAGATGSTNGQFGIGGNWYLTNTANPSGVVLVNGSAPNGSSTLPTITTTVTSPTLVNASGATVNPPGAAITSTLSVSSFVSADAGTYVFIVTNSPNGTTINSAATAPATISFISPAANSFAAAVTNPALGALAFWPLNETGDPSSGTIVAYDWVGQHNGWYGWNTDTSTSNRLDALPPISGPTSLTGLGYTSAYGGTNGLDWSFVNIPQGPSFPSSQTQLANSTNATFVAWVYPRNSEAANTALISERMNGAYQSNALGFGGTAGALGYQWANNGNVYNSGLTPSVTNWNFVAYVISPSNLTVYLGGTNHILQANANGSANTNLMGAWGTNMQIGTDLAGGSVMSRAFFGNISSVAIFSNTLSAAQIETLWAAGLGGPSIPVITTQPAFATYESMAGGVSPVISPAGYGGAGSAGYWQFANSVTAGVTNWATVTSAHFIQPTVVTNGTLLTSVLQATNFQAADAGTYQFIITNSAGAATSSVVNLVLYNVASGSFIAQATNAAYGMVSLWPLDETNDPSKVITNAAMVAVAYDIVGGFNGTYGTNADDGGGNSKYGFPKVVGPGSNGLVGMPTNGALGTIQNSGTYPNTYVSVPTTPTIPRVGNYGTNVTILGWIYPTNNPELTQTGLFTTRVNVSSLSYANYTGTLGTNGVLNALGWQWNNQTNTYGYDSGVVVPPNMWSMVGLVVSPSNTLFFVANTNEGVITATQWWTNGPGVPVQAYVPWGTLATIGSDQYTAVARNFGGSMSSFAMFTNSLTIPQIEALFTAGLTGNGGSAAPIIVADIAPAFRTNYLIAGGSSTNSITATAYGGTNLNGYWQVLSAGNWVALNNTDFSPSVGSTVPASFNMMGTLSVTNFQALDAGSYRLFFTNGVGPGVASSVVTLAVAPTPAAGTFAGQLLNPANGMGAVAYWPLNETGDTSGGAAGLPPSLAAFEYIGGYNGTYGTNAQDGGTNVGYHYSPDVGPGAQGLTGLPTQGALGVTNSATALDSYITTITSPFFPTDGLTYGTNVSIVGWIYPSTNLEVNQGGIFEQRSGSLGAVNTTGLEYGGSGVNTIDAHWNTDPANLYGGGLLTIPSFTWNLVAVVVSPSGLTFYVGNTNQGLVSTNYLTNNMINIPFGKGLYMGTDPSAIPGRNFVGYMSSFAMFSNSLTIPQMDLLFASGLSNAAQISPIVAPVSPQFQTNYLIAGGYSSSIVVNGYGGTNGVGYWQKQTAPGVLSALPTPDLATAAVVTNGSTLQGTLYVTNFTAASDAGSYVLVISNQVSGVSAYATSGVVVLSLVTPTVGSFAALAISNGAVAFWPLNETNDPSSGMAAAYDIVGGFNGLYGTNAMDGATNSLNHWPPALGPSSPPMLGFPSAPNGALGSFQNIASNIASYVTTTGTPTLSPTGTGATNATFLAWVYPTNNPEANGTGVFMTRVGNFGATNTAGIQLITAAAGTAGYLGYHWNNDVALESAYSSGLPIPLNSWSMIAVVITPSNNFFYVANTNNGVISAVQPMFNGQNNTDTNIYVGMGGGATIGTDPGNAPGRNFGGLISSVAMFSNSLSVTQIQALYETGLNLDSQAPYITQNPTPASWTVLPGKTVTFAAAGYGGTNAGGYWQVNYGTGWKTVNATTVGSTVSVDIASYSVPYSAYLANQSNAVLGSGLTLFTNNAVLYSTLTITNAQTGDTGSYQLVITNSPYGTVLSATSASGVLVVYSPPTGSFIAQATNSAYGLVALWPLNETADPSGALTGTPAIAYDIINQFNGTYGANADDGGGNAAYGFPRVPSPTVTGAPGLPTQGALGSIQNNGTYPNTYVTVPVTPTIPKVGNYGTNETFMGWIYPTIATEVSQTGLLVTRPGGTSSSLSYGAYTANMTTGAGSLGDVPTTDGLGWTWNNLQNTYGYCTPLVIPPYQWSLVGFVVSPTNTVFYVGNPSAGLTSYTQMWTNGAGVPAQSYVAWGGLATIGTDQYSSPLRNFGGYMSSFAMFTNSLTVTNIENLFNAGVANDVQQPLFVTNPLSYQFITNSGFSNNVKFVASVYGGQPNITGCWQMASTPGVWNNLVSSTAHYQGGVPTNGTTWTNLENSTLYITNITSADVGSYRLLVTNGMGNWSTSVVATIYLINPSSIAASSFEAVANNGMGLVALWPLNETQDPSSAMSNNPAEAFDLIGGNNGFYGLNANNGGGNLLNGFGSVPVPGSGGPFFTGLPTTGGVLGASNGLLNSFVTTLSSPVTFTNSSITNTNMTIIAWVNPLASEVANTGLVFERTPQVDGLMYSPAAGANQLGYTWNNVGTNVLGPAIPSNSWSMVAMVITGTNTTLYVANAVNGVLPNPVVPYVVSNAYQSWGGALALGGDTGNNPASTFSGQLSSVAIFSNALSLANIQSLFLAGYDLGLIPSPVITTQPATPNYLLYTNANVTISAAGFGYPPAGGYWQFANNSSVVGGVTNWTILQNSGGAGNNSGIGVAGGAQLQGSGIVALQITNVIGADAGTYELVYTNGNLAGTAATSSPVTLALVPNAAEPQPGSFAATAVGSGLGVVAFWPLNETNDPSTGSAQAYDVIGGNNGLYGTNAANYGNGVIGNVADSLPAVQGPAASGLVGFPAGGALGSLQNWKVKTYVTMSNTPFFSGLTSGNLTATNSTNMTLVAWINPRTNEGAGTGLMMMRNGTLGATRTDGMDYGPTTPNLGYIWDNNAAPTYNLNSGPAIPNSNWSMVALVISPSNSILYVGNSTNMNAYIQTIVNTNEPWGGGMAIGGDPGNSANAITNRSFGGSISSVAMFSNSLNVGQIEALWEAGMSNGAQTAPFITQQPAANVELLAPGGISTITAAGFASLPGGGYWQKWNGSSWVIVNPLNTDINSNTITTTLGGTTGTWQVGALTFTNFHAADAGSYELVVTNSGGKATSSVVNITPYNVQPNSFAAVADSIGYGAVALWPLSETVDPSTGNTGPFVVAFDVVGGFNGYYGTNANNGGGNLSNSWTGVAGPGSAAYNLIGLPSTGALRVTNIAAYANSFVFTSNSPTFAANTENVSIVGWIYPTSAGQSNSAGIFITANGGPGTAGLQYDNALADLGYHWDNNSGTTFNFQGPALIPSTWNMVALVITPTNSQLYVGTTNVSGLLVATQTTNNQYESWGNALQIGTDLAAATPPGRNFAGLMSSFAMFNQSLSVAQVQNLYAAGISNGLLVPWMQVQPNPNLEIAAGASVTFSATAYTGSTGVAYWQTNTGSGWGTIANNSDVVASSVYGTTVGASLVDALQITNFQAGDVASYQCVFANNAGSVTSIVVNITAYNAAPGTYAYTIANNKALGAVALWPLNETNDASTGTVIAYDVIGGFNGVYQTNAQNGGTNSWLATSTYAANLYQPVQGPSSLSNSVPFSGLPSTAFGSLNNVVLGTLVVVSNSPFFPVSNTNVSIVLWFDAVNTPHNPTYPGGYCDLLMEVNGMLGAGGNNGVQFNAGGYVMGYDWDNDANSAHSFNGGPVATTNSWNMYALAISPSNAVIYRGNLTNGLVAVTNALVNSNVPWGAGFEIGGNSAGSPGSVAAPSPGNFFNGAISSATMFSNTLSVAQLQALFDAGVAMGTNAPFIIANPLTASYELAPGAKATITATGFAGLNGGGYWQVNYGLGGGWVPLYTPDGAGTNAVPANGGNLAGILQITNYQASDAGSYELVLTNTNGLAGAPLYATSTVVSISTYAAPAGSFAAVVTNAAYGIVALWPLNETNDASTGTVIAYDVIGGFNGLYATNAQNGGTNSFILANDPLYILTNNGPLLQGYTGLNSNSLGSLQNIAALPATYVSVAAGPSFPPGPTNATNVSIIMWVYPNLSAQTSFTGLLDTPANGTAERDGLFYISGNGNSLGLLWDASSGSQGVNNSSGDTIPTNIWSMVGAVISPSNYVYVFGNPTNGLTLQTNTFANTNNPWGTPLTIGGDPSGAAGGARNFGGYISAAAMFSNTLSVAQLQSLFSAGIAMGTNVPFIIANPFASYELIPGSKATISATGFAGANGGGYWQVNYGLGGGWVPVSSADITASLVTNGGNLRGIAQITGFQATDAGSYELVLTNAYGGATSTVANVTGYSAPSTSFAAVAALYGAMALWPLNETNDPSAGGVIAYDVIGGLNGTYGTNSQDGGTNAGLYAVLQALNGGANIASYFSPVNGPYYAGLAGFPSTEPNGAYGSIPNLLLQDYVTIPVTPTMPAGATNMSIVAWVYPTMFTESANCGIFVTRSGFLGSPATDGIQYGNTANSLGYHGDNDGTGGTGTATYSFSGPIIPSNVWSMIVVATAPTNTSLYVCSTNGINVSVQTLLNIYQSWGWAAVIGGDPGSSNPGRDFGGAISTVAMFSNTLSLLQVQNLYDAGIANGSNAPYITQNPQATNLQLIPGVSVTMNAGGYVGPSGGGYWQFYSGGNWGPVTSPDASFTTNVGANLTLGITITNYQAQDSGSYRLVITNLNGLNATTLFATSTVATLKFYSISANTFISAVTNSAFGAVAYWPLNETIDPSTGGVTAYEVIGGYNGTYQTNAQDGAANAGLLAQLGSTANALDYVSPVPGPASAAVFGYAGLPATAYSSINGLLNQTLVTTAASPTFPAGGTNATFVMWIYPNASMAAPGVYLAGAPNYADLVSEVNGEFGATSTDGAQLNVVPGGSGNLQVGYNWDNNLGADNTFNTGMQVPSNIWSMYAFAISPTNTVFYLGNTNGLKTVTQTVGHTYRPWGGGISIGGDIAAYPGPGATAISNFFQGSISSVAIFTNSLNIAQISTLFQASGGVLGVPPGIVTNPPPIQPLLPGGSAAFTVTGYGGTNASGYWRKSNTVTTLFVPITSPDFSGTNGTVSNGIYQVSTMVVTNFNPATDVGTYVFVLTNGAGSATSTPLTLQAVTPALGTFASTVAQYALPWGAMAFWPLNEIGDCSTGTNIAYDIIGGFNGIYGTNAQNGGINTKVDSLYSAVISAVYDPVQGPGSASFNPSYTGLPATAYGGIHLPTNTPGSAVTTASGPTIPVTQSNISYVMWIEPNTPQTVHEGLFTMRTAGVETNGLSTGVTSGQLNYNWNNLNTAWASGLVLNTNGVWSMAAMVVTPSNTTLYLGNTLTGLQSATQTGITNVMTNDPGGVPIYIGTDPSTTGDAFGGAISSVVMFSNALTPAQIETLFDAGTSLGLNAPFFVSQPAFPASYQTNDISPTNASYELVTNIGSVTIAATAYTGPDGGGYWQKMINGIGWGPVTSPRASNATFKSDPNSLLLNCSLTITNVTGADNGSYQVVITNAGGTVVSPIMVTITNLPAPPVNSFEDVALRYGAAAYWPLSDNVDPSVGYYSGPGGTPINVLEAFDVIGGWNGYYQYDAMDGGQNGNLFGAGNGVGPRPSQFQGFDANNYALVATNGLPPPGSLGETFPTNGYVVTAGSPTIPAGTTNMTLVAWVNPTVYTEPALAGIVVMRSGGQLDGLTYGPNFGGATFLDYQWAGGNGGLESFVDPPSNTWSMLAMVTTPTSVTLYICNTNGISVNPQIISNAYQSWGQPITFGGDPVSLTGTNNFNGEIGAVAIFTNALSLSQISVLYDAGLDLDAGPPTIVIAPSSTAAYESRTAVFSVVASGTTALSYQWQALNTSHIWVNLTDGVSPTYGILTGTTSNILTIIAPVIRGLIPKTFTYQVIVTDSGGSTNAGPVTLTVAPTVGTLSAYSQAVISNNPVAYYELNEAAGPVAFDFWGGLSGTYETNVTVAGIEGPDQTLGGGLAYTASAPLFTNAFIVGTNWLTNSNPNASNNCVDNSDINLPPLNINSNAMTFIAWIWPNENQPYTNGLLYCRGSGTDSGFGFADTTSGTLGYNWNNVAGTYNYNSGLRPLATNWNMVAYVISPSNATIYCYTTNANGQLQAVNNVANAFQAWGDSSDLGDDPYVPTGQRQFDGSIAEVAIFNKSLTSDQINFLFYVATGVAVPPVFTTQPGGAGSTTGNLFVNQGASPTVTFTAVAANGPNLGFTWQIPGFYNTMTANGTYTFPVYPYAGASFTVSNSGNTATLTISNAQAGMGAYSGDVAATNSLSPVTTYSSYFTLPSPPSQSQTGNGQIAVQDGSQTATYTASANISRPFTVTSGANVLVVEFASAGVNSEANTTLTYGGMSLTQGGMQGAYNGANNGVNSGVYYLMNPPVGASTITGTAANGNVWIAAYTLNSVDTTIAPVIGKGGASGSFVQPVSTAAITVPAGGFAAFVFGVDATTGVTSSTISSPTTGTQTKATNTADATTILTGWISGLPAGNTTFTGTQGPGYDVEDIVVAVFTPLGGGASSSVSIFPTPAIWTANFCLTNDALGQGGAVLPFTGPGVINTGTIWNAVNYAVATVQTPPLTNVSSTNDIGTITNTGVSVAIYPNGTSYSVIYQTAAGGSMLLKDYASFASGTSQGNGMTLTMPPGFYNVFIIGNASSFGSRSMTWTVHNTSLTYNNGTANWTSYVLGQNCIIFTNVLATNGVLTFSDSATTAGNAPWNGLQVQYIGPYSASTMPLTVTMSGKTPVLTYLNATLESSTSVLGPWTPVVDAPAPVYGVTNTYSVPSFTIPSGQSSAGRYYISVPMPLTSPAVGIPIE